MSRSNLCAHSHARTLALKCVAAQQVEPKVNEELLQQLQEMGFSKHK